MTGDYDIPFTTHTAAYITVKSCDLGVRSRFDLWFHSILAVVPWLSCLTSLNLTFVMCKMGEIFPQ